MASGKIPFTAILQYARVYGLAGVELDRLATIVSVVHEDIESFLADQEAKKAKSTKK